MEAKNPGLSPEAWEKFHKILTKLNAKYALELEKENEKGGTTHDRNQSLHSSRTQASCRNVS